MIHLHSAPRYHIVNNESAREYEIKLTYANRLSKKNDRRIDKRGRDVLNCVFHPGKCTFNR